MAGKLLPTLAPPDPGGRGWAAGAVALGAAVAGIGAAPPWTVEAARATPWSVDLSGGYRLDLALAGPLLGVVGPEAWRAVGGTLWLGIAGATAAWLGGRWWGSVLAGGACGVAWEVACRGPLHGGASALALAVLPLVLGLGVRALDRPAYGAVAAVGVAVGAVAIEPGMGLRWALLVSWPALALAWFARGRAAALSVALGGAGFAMLVALPVWVWDRNEPVRASEAVFLPFPLLGLGVAGALGLRGGRRHLALPVLLVGGGALVGWVVPDAATPVAGLGLALLAGRAAVVLGAAIRRLRPGSPENPAPSGTPALPAG